MDNIFNAIEVFLENAGLNPDYISSISTFAILIATALIYTLIFRIITGPVSRVLQKYVKTTETKWDNRLLEHTNLVILVSIVLAIITDKIAPILLHYYPERLPLAGKIASVMIVGFICTFIIRLINVAYKGLREDDSDISGLAVLRNIINTIVVAVGILLTLSIILSKNITYLLSGIGATAAVFSFVFKDSILGMAAGIRLVSNKMLHHNDWIRIPARSVDGRITDITLTAVKVRNWDNSISTIPPHSLMSEGFCNMEEMLRLGSRRLMRSVNISVDSIRLLENHEIQDIKEHLRFESPRITRSVNQKQRISNVTLFRHYIEHLIAVNPFTDRGQRQMVRELQPGEYGLPIEIFYFVKIENWEEFEQFQADFIDNILAVADLFSLNIFQLPTMVNSPSFGKKAIMEREHTQA